MPESAEKGRVICSRCKARNPTHALCLHYEECRREDAEEARWRNDSAGLRFCGGCGVLLPSHRENCPERDRPPVPDPAAILGQAADLFRERNARYGGTYRTFGDLMVVLYPRGFPLRTPGDWNRLAILTQLATKLLRYASDPESPHLDSVSDMMPYAAILKELDLIAASEREERRGSQGSGR